MGKNGNSDRLFSWAPKSLQIVTAPMKLLALWKKSYDKPRQHIKKQRHHFTNKGLHSQSYGFSSNRVWMWELDPKEGWALLNCSAEEDLRVPWTVRRSNQAILKKINPEYSLEGLMLKFKLKYLATWCEEPTHWKRFWCRERLRAEEEIGHRWWDS